MDDDDRSRSDISGSGSGVRRSDVSGDGSGSSSDSRSGAGARPIKVGSLLSRLGLSVDGCLGPGPCFAGLDSLVPSVIELAVTSTSTVSEPRTAATATTDFSGLLDGAALRAY